MSDQDLGPDWVPAWWRVEFGGLKLLIGAVTVPLQDVAMDRGLADFDQRLRAMVVTAADADDTVAALRPVAVVADAS